MAKRKTAAERRAMEELRRDERYCDGQAAGLSQMLMLMKKSVDREKAELAETQRRIHEKALRQNTSNTEKDAEDFLLGLVTLLFIIGLVWLVWRFW